MHRRVSTGAASSQTRQNRESVCSGAAAPPQWVRLSKTQKTSSFPHPRLRWRSGKTGFRVLYWTLEASRFSRLVLLALPGVQFRSSTVMALKHCDVCKKDFAAALGVCPHCAKAAKTGRPEGASAGKSDIPVSRSEDLSPDDSGIVWSTMVHQGDEGPGSDPAVADTPKPRPEADLLGRAE